MAGLKPHGALSPWATLASTPCTSVNRLECAPHSAADQADQVKQQARGEDGLAPVPDDVCAPGEEDEHGHGDQRLDQRAEAEQPLQSAPRTLICVSVGARTKSMKMIAVNWSEYETMREVW